MQNQGAHDQCVATLSGHDEALCPSQDRSAAGIDTTKLMRRWDESERPILLGAAIDVNANCEELPKDRVRRLYKHRAFFFTPARQRRVTHSTRNGDAQVLVNRHQPILFSRLLKERALNCPNIGRQVPANLSMNHYLVREISTPVFLQQPPRTDASRFGQ